MNEQELTLCLHHITVDDTIILVCLLTGRATADTDDQLHIMMIARSSISIHQAIFAPCRRC